jgi:hypothetical protein
MNKRQKCESVFSVLKIEDINNSSFQLLGSGKFKTPRCHDMTIPILIVSKARVMSIQLLSDANVSASLSCAICKKDAWSFYEWLLSVDTERNLMVHEEDDAVILKIRITSFDDVTFRDNNVSSMSTQDAIRLLNLNGTFIKCALELPCMWFMDASYGLTLNLIEANILTDNSMPVCLISDEDNVDHPVSLNIEPSYVPFQGN